MSKFIWKSDGGFNWGSCFWEMHENRHDNSPLWLTRYIVFRLPFTRCVAARWSERQCEFVEEAKFWRLSSAKRYCEVMSQFDNDQ